MTNDPFEAYSKFRETAQENRPDLFEFDKPITGLDQDMTIAILLPRTDDDMFFLPTYMHYGLKTPKDDGSGDRNTSCICTAMHNNGSCAACDAESILSTSSASADKTKATAIKPNEKVYVCAWLIPVEFTTGEGDFTLPNYDGTLVSWNVLNKAENHPRVTAMGLSGGVWNNLLTVIKTRGGVDKFVGRDGTPFFIRANGKPGKGRRYKEPTDMLELDDKFRPPKNVEGLNLMETVDFPTPEYVAEIVDHTFPGILPDLSKYSSKKKESKKSKSVDTDTEGDDALHD